MSNYAFTEAQLAIMKAALRYDDKNNKGVGTAT